MFFATWIGAICVQQSAWTDDVPVYSVQWTNMRLIGHISIFFSLARSSFASFNSCDVDNGAADL